MHSRTHLSSALALFRLASYYNNNNPVAFHLRFRRTLFNILPSYSRGAVLQFIHRRWQQQPPAGSTGLIKFTDSPAFLFLPPSLLRHGTVSVSLRLRPSRFMAKRQSAWQFVSLVLRKSAHRNRARPWDRERESFCITKPTFFFFSPIPLLAALCSLSYSQPCPLPFGTPLCDYRYDETVSVIDRRKIAFFRLVYYPMKYSVSKNNLAFPVSRWIIKVSRWY